MKENKYKKGLSEMFNDYFLLMVYFHFLKGFTYDYGRLERKNNEITTVYICDNYFLSSATKR